MTTLSTVAATFGGHLGSVTATAPNPARPQLANAAATSPQTPRRCSVSKRRRKRPVAYADRGGGMGDIERRG